ncbi:MAG: DNA/RNA non-specific endonuclease [Planctomycetia bacterium]|nr:DNA/RNA non-specific endonuclease [Planctomycetia bacterium]
MTTDLFDHARKHGVPQWRDLSPQMQNFIKKYGIESAPEFDPPGAARRATLDHIEHQIRRLNVISCALWYERMRLQFKNKTEPLTDAERYYLAKLDVMCTIIGCVEVTWYKERTKLYNLAIGEMAFMATLAGNLGNPSVNAMAVAAVDASMGVATLNPPAMGPRINAPRIKSPTPKNDPALSALRGEAPPASKAPAETTKTSGHAADALEAKGGAPTQKPATGGANPTPTQPPRSTPATLTDVELQALRVELLRSGKQIVLEPSRSYQTAEGTIYRTNVKGQVDEIEFTLNGPGDVKAKGDPRTARSSETTPLGEPLSGVKGDVGFHARPDTANGIATYPNVFPGSGTLNNSAFKSVELKYVQAAREGARVDVKINKMFGPADDLRPTHIRVTIKKDGLSWSKTFANDGSTELLDAEKTALKAILGL